MEKLTRKLFSKCSFFLKAAKLIPKKLFCHLKLKRTNFYFLESYICRIQTNFKFGNKCHVIRCRRPNFLSFFVFSNFLNGKFRLSNLFLLEIFIKIIQPEKVCQQFSTSFLQQLLKSIL